VSEANVTNIEALERFRSSLVLFLERAGFALDEVSEEVKRTRIWLQTEQAMKLTHEMKRRQREMEQLEQEMFTARLSDLAQKKTGMQMQINKKRREIHELEGKIRAVKGWLRNFDSVVETEARKAEKLRQQIDIEMARGVTFLTESVRQLRAYSEDA
jgi:predicted RNase H-like nuclease (RuvC/YqgF family)